MLTNYQTRVGRTYDHHIGCECRRQIWQTQACDTVKLEIIKLKKSRNRLLPIYKQSSADWRRSCDRATRACLPALLWPSFPALTRTPGCRATWSAVRNHQSKRRLCQISPSGRSTPGARAIVVRRKEKVQGEHNATDEMIDIQPSRKEKQETTRDGVEITSGAN